MRVTVSLAPGAASLLSHAVEHANRAKREADLILAALVAQGGVTQPAVLLEVHPEAVVVEVPDDGA